ncbi:PH domain-containing protein [Streptomyces sp. NPDC048564]|uniref:PH domain-containing protein n=1 Tax=unclassified Streptomyces TaxID=2593676 RepID=UPI0033CA2DB7
MRAFGGTAEHDGHHHVPDLWIGLDAAALRRNWCWTGFLTLSFACLAVAVALTEPTDRWWWAGTVGVCGLGSLYYMINRGYGRTLLSSGGMEFHTLVGRRSFRWDEIARIEPRSHLTRGGEWWEVRAVRVHGRPLAVPGVFSSGRRDASFEEKLAVIRRYWSHAALG